MQVVRIILQVTAMSVTQRASLLQLKFYTDGVANKGSYQYNKFIVSSKKRILAI